MLTDERKLLMEIGIGLRLEVERLEMIANKVKNRGHLTSCCCCCQVIELAVERETYSLFRRLGLSGRGEEDELYWGG